MKLEVDINELRITQALEAYRLFDTNESGGISPEEAGAMGDEQTSLLLNDAYYSENGADGNNRVAFFKSLVQNGRLPNLFFEKIYLKELAAQDPSLVGQSLGEILEMGASVCTNISAEQWVDSIFIDILGKNLISPVLNEMEEKNPEFVSSRKKIPYTGNILSPDLNKDHFIEAGEITKYEKDKPWRDRFFERLTTHIENYPLNEVSNLIAGGFFKADQKVAALQLFTELPTVFRAATAISAGVEAHRDQNTDDKETMATAMLSSQFVFDPEGFLEILITLQEADNETTIKGVRFLLSHLDDDSKKALLKLDQEKYGGRHFGVEEEYRFFLMIPGPDPDNFCPPPLPPALPPGVKDI